MNVKTLHTSAGTLLSIQSDWKENVKLLLAKNRGFSELPAHGFFQANIEDLHDPFLIPDMERAVDRIVMAQKNKERIVIFGDYDVDGVSSTALLVRFLIQELGCSVSYRLPHRVHDGYGLKPYFFDELTQKNVTLVITVDCGTRDIDAIEYAQQKGIDVIVTDHHAVPEVIPQAVVGILNPKRNDSLYPFPALAGAGVALKLAHAILLRTQNQEEVHSLLRKYIDFAALGTVADCMPLIGENRIITKLGLEQMKQSESSGLRKFVELSGKDITDNADFIGFQVGPRINASGRMDTPLTALRWLLASDDRSDEFLEEIEALNQERQMRVKSFTEKALAESQGEAGGVLFFSDDHLEHGLIGLIAGKLTEAYHRPSIVLCSHTPKDESAKREYETKANPKNTKDEEEEYLVASCRSPEWCHLMELLDACQDLFVRYGGHRQAAGFTIARKNLAIFQERITTLFGERYDLNHLPPASLRIESPIPPKALTLDTLNSIDTFRPFGIGNPRPLWLLENITITECRTIGSTGNHLTLQCAENPDIRFVYWGGNVHAESLAVGNIVSLVIELDRNEWNGKVSVQGMIRDIVL